MTRTKIVFWNMDSIMQFMEIIGRHDYDAELVCGGRTVNAKALLDVMSMQSAQASELRIFSVSCEDLLRDLDLYMEQYKLEKARAAV